ncbi:restriction endonuclease subunit S [Pseudoalteromonas sp. SG44-1]|uniref:restriction endonuclease subunit S n=1 Tax=unclassified Pseudoalteromonas TaxID=194690 RepID=UPI0015FEC51D|nr:MULTISPECIES: restriction endonuclease subunit S [unclassified Pseudoalteromonas]MBB1419227.1 restriction endonuclease subunit S [Pseudoalteromonas sp. SG44-1]MBB1478028.1 restriction endonuclease subunit S [Pseudoalteromonas sp. SG41-2]
MSWPLVKLGDVVKFIGGSQPPKSTFKYEPMEGYIRLLQIRDYKSDNNLTFIPESSTKKFCSKKDIMIGRYGPPVFQILRGLEGAYNVALMKAEPSESVDRDYLFYFLRQDTLFRLIDGLSQRTAGQSGIDMDALKSYPMLLPPLHEQKRIAAILDKADTIRRKRQQAIQLADDFLRSVFLDMFGDPVTNPKGWELRSLASLCRKITDGTHHSPPIVEKGFPYVTAKHLKKTGLEFHAKPWYVSEEEHKKIFSRCNPEKNDVLYIKDGATTGLAAINEYDFEFSMLSSLALLKPNFELVNSEFLCMFLNHPRTKLVLTANMAGAAITRLTLAKIKDVKVPLPDINTQEKFKEVYISVRAILNKVKASDGLSEQEFNSLSQKAFAGQL